MNLLIAERIIELSERKSRFTKLKLFLSEWKNVAYLSIGILTLKIAAEQLVMLLR